MTEKIQLSNYLAVPHLQSLCDKLDVEIAKVQAGDSAAIKTALFCLVEISDAQAVAASVLRKFALSLVLGPADEVSTEDLLPSIPDPFEEPKRASGSWEEKVPLIEAALVALDKHNEGSGWGGLNDAVTVLVEEIDVHNHLIPLLESRDIKCGAEDIKGGFISLMVGKKKFTWSLKISSISLIKKWHKILQAISNEWKDELK